MEAYLLSLCCGICVVEDLFWKLCCRVLVAESFVESLLRNLSC